MSEAAATSHAFPLSLSNLRRAWGIITFTVGLISALGGAVIGATWKVAGYDNRLTEMHEGGITRAALIAALTTRVNTLEIDLNASIGRGALIRSNIADLQDHAHAIDVRLDFLRDGLSAEREALARQDAQLGFLFQHAAPGKRP